MFRHYLLTSQVTIPPFNTGGHQDVFLSPVTPNPERCREPLVSEKGQPLFQRFPVSLSGPKKKSRFYVLAYLFSVCSRSSTTFRWRLSLLEKASWAFTEWTSPSRTNCLCSWDSPLKSAPFSVKKKELCGNIGNFGIWSRSVGPWSCLLSLDANWPTKIWVRLVYVTQSVSHGKVTLCFMFCISTETLRSRLSSPDWYS